MGLVNVRRFEISGAKGPGLKRRKNLSGGLLSRIERKMDSGARDAKTRKRRGEERRKTK